MTNDELAKARELCEKATGSEWKINHQADGSRCLYDVKFGDTSFVIATSKGSSFVASQCKNNMIFISASRTLVPQLLDLVEALQKRNEIMREALEKYSTAKAYDNVIGEFIVIGRDVAEEALKKEKEIK